MMPCYRVPVRYFRDGIIVEGQGPIIDAADPAEAAVKAEVIFGSRREFAGVGTPTLRHSWDDDRNHGTRAVYALVPEAAAPLSESLYRMVAQIRARRRAS